eukprot:TRINITY_DN1738_c0_g1_i1.p4 TRINITY_DN1738_c0_g1~~TRINITY_DN1738_c0_g1_i1.p4  ORF type:complete len:140 (+),score=17.45 TRINITY_DN1738_c0_g1_i1:841-1260(+)
MQLPPRRPDGYDYPKYGYHHRLGVGYTAGFHPPPATYGQRATTAVDVDGDGRADYYVSGADHDGDGIPDAMQSGRQYARRFSAPAAPPGFSPPTASVYAPVTLHSMNPPTSAPVDDSGEHSLSRIQQQVARLAEAMDGH